MITLHNVSDVATGAVAGASLLLRVFLPPPEKFAQWPRLQKWYALVYLIVQWIALNK